MQNRFSLTQPKTGSKKVTIVYSGGDDLFVVGAWNEVIEAAVDLRNAFSKYTDGALTFSAGIGLFEQGYPISRMAYEVQKLESAAKGIDDKKNAISIFGAELEKDKPSFKHTYKWDVFLNHIVEEKLRLIQKFFDSQSDEERAKGNSFLYKLMDYIIKSEEKINIARCAYLLGRMAPSSDAPAEVKNTYSQFSKSLYDWILKPDDRKQLLTAINIYVYLNRDNKKEEK